MIYTDFLKCYRSDDFDFELVDNEKIDFILDSSSYMDFQLDITTPFEEYIPILSQLQPSPDNTIAYTEKYITTEDTIPIIDEDGYHLSY